MFLIACCLFATPADHTAAAAAAGADPTCAHEQRQERVHVSVECKQQEDRRLNPVKTSRTRACRSYPFALVLYFSIGGEDSRRGGRPSYDRLCRCALVSAQQASRCSRGFLIMGGF